MGLSNPVPASHPASGIEHPASPRRGLTLIEMLVALAVTLVMMAAVVNLFANISGSIRNRRAVIEVSGQLRQVRARLALDLAGATCDGTTWQQPGEGAGYIEIIEGPWKDADPSILTDGVDPPTAANPELEYATSLVPSGGDPRITATLSARANGWVMNATDVTNGAALGDWDDVLTLTVRSESEPFRGRVPFFNSATTSWEQRLESSSTAEVIWYCGENDLSVASPHEPGMRRIYRRALLIAPATSFPDLNTFEGVNNHERLLDYYTKYDVSARVENGELVGNSLDDLTKREFRFCRAIDSIFPHLLSRGMLGSSAEPRHLVLDDALAFDVRVYDPGAPLLQVAAGTVLQPGDPGWPEAAIAARTAATLSNTLSGFGAYVDLGWAAQSPTSVNLYWPPDSASNYSMPMQGFDKLPPGSPVPVFHVPHQAGWHPRLVNAPFGYPAVYDTWSFHYENNGVNEDDGEADLVVTTTPNWRNTLDQGENGLDDDGMNGVDDPGERETAPPYDFDLRGVKVSLRVYERDARQIRETSVTHSFAP